MRSLARQEKWVQYAVAAKALGGSAWELWRMPEPERSFWLNRGLLYNDCQVEADEEDRVERGL